MLLNTILSLTHCDTDDGVAGWWVEVVWCPGDVVVMKQRHHMGQGGEGDISHAVGLLDVNYHFSYLFQKKRFEADEHTDTVLFVTEDTTNYYQ